MQPGLEPAIGTAAAHAMRHLAWLAAQRLVWGMDKRAPAIAPETVALIKQTIAERMRPFGYVDARVRAGEDHDGDPVIFIDVDYTLSEMPLDLAVSSPLTTLLRDRLWAVGEERFPHINHHFDERQKVKPRRRVRR